MVKYTCKYCGTKAFSQKRLCYNCNNKAKIITRIKAMLDSAVKQSGGSEQKWNLEKLFRA